MESAILWSRNNSLITGMHPYQFLFNSLYLLFLYVRKESVTTLFSQIIIVDIKGAFDDKGGQNRCVS